MWFGKLARFGFFLFVITAQLAQAQVFKIATISPDGSAWMKAMRAAGKEIAEATESRVKLKFYPGGVMGDDKAVLRKMRFGQLQGAAIASSALTNQYTDVQLYGMPMLFDGYDEVDYVRERMDPVIAEGLEAAGFVVLGFAEVGFAHAMAKAPIRSVSDARERKVWIPDNDPGAAAAIQAFGITPIPLTVADVLPSLQTGLIDAVAVPPVGAVALQWHTQLKYLSDLPLLYIYGFFTLNSKQFGKLAGSDQVLVRKTIGAALQSVNSATRIDQKSAIDALLNQGIQKQTPSAAEISEWKTLARAARQRMLAEGTVTASGFAAVNAYLEEFRNAPRTQP